MTTKKRLGRLAAGASALALVSAGLIGTAASADTAPGNINFDRKGSITIHKMDGNTGEAGDGTVMNPEPGSPLVGVVFTLYPVTGVDLEDPDAWDGLADLTVADVTLGTGVLSDPTDEDGVTSFEELSVGLYYVEETSHGDNIIVSEVPPFFVTIPLPSGGDWLYDVHVYPKNLTDKTPPVKEVTDPAPGYAPGDEVTWTITKELPALQEGESFSKLVFTDTLDDRLSIDAADVKVAGFDVVDDYTVAVTGQDVTVTFTEEGLAKLVSGTSVVVTLVTTVSADLSEEDAAGIVNSALVNLNGSEQETEDATVYYGGIQVGKLDAANEKPLAGAEFDVYATDAHGDKTGSPLNAAPLVTNAAGNFDDAFIVWVGTQASDTQTYILVETKAPAGYILPEGDAAETSVTVGVGTETVAVASGLVTNTKQDVPDLPLTGAQGTLLMTVIGVGLLGAGAAAIGIRRARANN